MWHSVFNTSTWLRLHFGGLTVKVSLALGQLNSEEKQLLLIGNHSCRTHTHTYRNKIRQNRLNCLGYSYQSYPPSTWFFAKVLVNRGTLDAWLNRLYDVTGYRFNYSVWLCARGFIENWGMMHTLSTHVQSWIHSSQSYHKIRTLEHTSPSSWWNKWGQSSHHFWSPNHLVKIGRIWNSQL